MKAEGRDDHHQETPVAEDAVTGQVNLKDDARVHVVNAEGAGAPPATAQAVAPAAAN